MNAKRLIAARWREREAGLSAILLLAEIESERAEGCRNVYSLLAMAKAQLDQTAARLCPDE